MHPKSDDLELPEPDQYTGIEPEGTIQDDEADDPQGGVITEVRGLVSTTKFTPVDYVASLGWYSDAHEHRPFDVTNLCQKCARLSYEVEALNGSAWIQYLTTSPEHRHITSNFDDAPIGSFLITKGSNPAGHIFEARRPFANGTPSGWSNDVMRTGYIDAVSRNAPRDHWGHKNIAWIVEINGFVLDLTHGAPPKPLENKRYKRIERSINILQDIRLEEKKAHDVREARLIGDEIRRLKKLYSEVKHT